MRAGTSLFCLLIALLGGYCLYQECIPEFQTHDFRFPWAWKIAPKTDFRAWVSDGKLCFHFDAADSHLIIADECTGESTLDGEDRVELFFAKSSDTALKDYWCIEIDPLGRVHDYHAQHYRTFDSTWNCPGLTTTAHRTPTGYEVHGSLPLASLSTLLADRITHGSKIRLGLFRAEFYGQGKTATGEANDNWLSWVSPDSPQPDFHVPSAFRLLTLP